MTRLIKCDRCKKEFLLEKSSWKKIKTLVIHNTPLKKKNSKSKIFHICINCLKVWGLK